MSSATLPYGCINFTGMLGTFRPPSKSLDLLDGSFEVSTAESMASFGNNPSHCNPIFLNLQRSTRSLHCEISQRPCNHQRESLIPLRQRDFICGSLTVLTRLALTTQMPRAPAARGWRTSARTPRACASNRWHGSLDIVGENTRSSCVLAKRTYAIGARGRSQVHVVVNKGRRTRE